VEEVKKEEPEPTIEIKASSKGHRHKNSELEMSFSYKSNQMDKLDNREEEVNDMSESEQE